MIIYCYIYSSILMIEACLLNDKNKLPHAELRVLFMILLCIPRCAQSITL